MRIVLDLQGAQGASRDRGIGRYSLSFAEFVLKHRRSHQIVIALNGLFAEGIEAIRGRFDGKLSQDDIRVWHSAGPVRGFDPDNLWRRTSSELLREQFLISLEPDIVHVSSPFEGYVDDAVFSTGLIASDMLTSVTVFDLIPLIQRGVYLDPNPIYAEFYHRRLEQLKRADLFLAISESSRQEAIEHLAAPAENIINMSAAADAHFKPGTVPSQEEEALRQRFGLARPFVMYSGATDERKNHLRLIEAFSLLPPALRTAHQLAIVGGLPQEHKFNFEAHALQCGLAPEDLVITNRVSDAEMVTLYRTCKLFVFASWHEGFGLPALEAMACGAPVVAAETSSLPEVIGRQDALFDPFDAPDMSRKIAAALSDDRFRDDLARHAVSQSALFSWDDTAQKAIAAFELARAKRVGAVAPRQPRTGPNPMPSLTSLIGKVAASAGEPRFEDLQATAAAIARNHSDLTQPQLLVDVSEFVRRDAKSGIQRVVRNVLREWLVASPGGFRVEPVYGDGDGDRPGDGKGYRYARRFRTRLGSEPDDDVQDDLIAYRSGDRFVGLDLQHHVVISQASAYQRMRDQGVTVQFVVYDLLPVKLPHAFVPGAREVHASWLDTLARTDGAICISRAVADELFQWLDDHGPERLRPFQISWFHLGADVAASTPTALPEDSQRVLESLSSRPTFLVVGTVEPRKGLSQTLAAFEWLWSEGRDVNLLVVGKQGWMVDEVAQRMHDCAASNNRFRWLQGISDEYLQMIYQRSDCLIAPSEGEGFGLPLIEAARHGLPLVARDLPVFREVAGEGAMYFDGNDPRILAACIDNWLTRSTDSDVPDSGRLTWLTWEQSADQLAQAVFGQRTYRTWFSRRG